MVDAMIITYNEILNLPHCLESLRGWTNRIFVIDSGSTDGTVEAAKRLGAEVVEHAWEGYAGQKNWGLDHLPFTSEWVLLVDADEQISKELQGRIESITSKPVEQVAENGFFINRLTYFLGQPIKHCGYFPSWNLRLFKRGKGRYERREVHEHIVLANPVGYIKEPMIHRDRRSLEHHFAKHNRYSTLEARQLFIELGESRREKDEANLTPETRRRRWLKRNVTRRVPLPGLWRFLYMYVYRLGVLDGRVGLAFCRFIGHYDAMVAYKLRTLLRESRQAGALERLAETDPALANGEEQPMAVVEFEPTSVAASLEAATEGTAKQHQPEPSPWSLREKVYRAVWMLAGRPIFRLSFHNWYRLRAGLLRLFGAKVGRGVRVRPSVHIEVPWLLEIEENATIGDEAILYSLGRIHIKKRAIISQYAHLCAGTHDYTDHRFPLIRASITIGEDVWIGADVFVGPGVMVGARSVVGARSDVFKDLPPGKVCVGSPARPIKDRILR